MKNNTPIDFNIAHYGRFKFNTEDYGYKTILITTAIQGRKGVRFGRLIQVRKKSGAYGTDTVILRESNGRLQSYHNMSFFQVAKEFSIIYEDAMKESDNLNLDNINDEYTIENQSPATGFVVHG
jgi:hypothetical protein